MTQIIKGGNLPVPGQAWRIEVVRRAAGAGVPEVTASALLLDGAGAAAGHPVLERAAIEGDRVVDRLDLDTALVAPDVQRIVLVAAGQDGTLGQVPGLSVRTLSAATGEQLALYEIDDATTETALVLGEYYRRDGGWKFRAVGEGYDSGLAGLAEDLGIEVPAPAPAPAPAGPVPLEAVGKSSGPESGTESEGASRTSALGKNPDPASAKSRTSPSTGPRTPSRGAGAIPVTPSPAPSPEVAAAAGILGGEFDDIVYSGRGGAKFAMDTTPPPGYVLVDVARTGKGGIFWLDSIDWNGKEAVHLSRTHPPHRFERRVMWCDNLYPLRFRLDCGSDEEWTIVIRPLSAARALGEGATGRGADVLLHTGPAGELVSRMRSTTSSGWLRVEGHKPRRPGAPAPYPQLLASELGRRPKDVRELPEGPLVVAVVTGEDDWSLEVGPARPPEEKKSGFWSRLRR
ncbi:TerD family protein [Streptomyces sp. NPDC093795]|uniref:TerD family protein n=1 Tax=Streptomyces sp. NPDC093795 TaxID=3366051 RepID=UPI0037FC373B